MERKLVALVKNQISLPTVLPQISKDLQQRIALVRENLGNYGQFVLRFNPDIQNSIANLRAGYVECWNMKYPSLNLIGHTYGNEQVVEWLKIQFFDLNNFVGVKEKMSDKQLTDVANLFYCDCYNLNISEVALFFLNYKLGKFGEFYGIVDPLKIMTAKNKFLAERITALNRNRERMQQERENEQRDNREQIKNAILAHNAEKRKKALNTKKKWL